jgi:hypothetical protein
MRWLDCGRPGRHRCFVLPSTADCKAFEPVLDVPITSPLVTPTVKAADSPYLRAIYDSDAKGA